MKLFCELGLDSCSKQGLPLLCKIIVFIYSRVTDLQLSCGAVRLIYNWISNTFVIFRFSPCWYSRLSTSFSWPNFYFLVTDSSAKTRLASPFNLESKRGSILMLGVRSTKIHLLRFGFGILGLVLILRLKFSYLRNKYRKASLKSIIF